ncbi:gasdermin-E-like [Myripristis murdjan]|uniref:gasdermin-E-like n=1 Tax=Myripristis murdjan TaxID=586833 RepID=UPI0011764944|nr:gasdermin-E-like [Myripristis murdjan]
MFSKATANFIRQIDPEGSLIHVSRLPDSHKLVPMALVVKRNRFWFWQKPKYQPTAFTLSDLLLGDTLLVPVVSETDFLTYAGTFGDVIGGQVDAKAGVVSVTLEGRGSTKLQSSFGKLKIEKVDVRKLLQDSNDRLVNMNHVLVQQLEKRAEVLAVLHERIFTTSPCSVIETRQDQGTCGAMLGLTGKLRSTVAVSVKDSNVKMDSDVSVEIPPGTVIAYSLLELEIKKDGHFEPCLQPSTTGGFEADSGTSSPSHDSVGTFCEIDGFEWAEEMVLGGQPLSTLQNELQKLEGDLSRLAELPQPTRTTLFQRLQETLRDRASLSELEYKLEERRRGEVPVSQDIAVSAILDLLSPGPNNHIENGGPDTSADLIAVHLLVSAMEAFPDEALSLVSECSPSFLEALNTLICRLKEGQLPLPITSLPAPLQDDQAFRWAQQLLRSTSVTLKTEADRLEAKTEDKPGVLPLVLCVAVHGLSSLCQK